MARWNDREIFSIDEVTDPGWTDRAARTDRITSPLGGGRARRHWPGAAGEVCRRLEIGREAPQGAGGRWLPGIRPDAGSLGNQTQPVGFGSPATLQAPFAGPLGNSS